MNSATSQLQQDFARPGFCWPHSQGQLPTTSTLTSALPSASTLTYALPSASTLTYAFPSASALPSASTLSSVSALSSALHHTGSVMTPPQAASLIGASSFYKAPLTSSSSTMLIPRFYQQSVTASPQLNVPSVIGQSNSPISAPLASLVPPPPVFPTPPTVNSIRASHSAAVRFPFPAGVGPMMSHFEMPGTDGHLIPQSARLNSNLALCSSAPLGGFANASLPSFGAASVATSVSGNGLHQFAIPRISQQAPEQPGQGVHFPLGQSSVSAGGDAFARDSGQHQTQHLFDLSNSIMSTAISKGLPIAQHHPQQTKMDCVSQLKTLALCDASVSSPLKSAESAETVKIPKETATIPLERSCTSSSSAGSAGEHHRSQQPHQMSCQVCYLAASNGLHFGARTCAACAAFFRRSISDQKRYICKRSQRCVIRAMETQGYRKMCRNCRMKRCLEIGMLPENVQNKRNKRDFYFADALSNAISQQQRQLRTTQQQMQSIRSSSKGAQSGAGAADQRREEGQGGVSRSPQVASTECQAGQVAAASSAEPIDFGSSSNQQIFGDAQRQNSSRECQQQQIMMSIDNTRTANGEQQQTTRAVANVQNDEQTATNRTPPWGTTLREI